MTLLLVAGMTRLGVVAAVAATITAERSLPQTVTSRLLAPPKTENEQADADP
jgi:hypothetical protein